MISKERDLRPESLFGWLWNRQRIVLVLAGALLFRLLLFDQVPVNYDSGFYLSDALRTTTGDVPFVDYYSRSPLFHYLLGGLLYFADSPLAAGRLFMISITLLVGYSIYRLTARLSSKEAGLFAGTIYLFTPLTIFWGTWIKTEPVAALFSVVGLLFVLPHLDDDTFEVKYGVLFGVLAGIAFFIRRVVIVHAAILVLFLLVYRLRRHDELVDAVRAAAAPAIAMSATLLVAYFVWGTGNVDLTIELINAHFLILFPGDARLPNSAGGSAVHASVLRAFLVFCSRCSERTVTITLQIVATTFPALLVAWLYFKDVLFASESGWDFKRVQAAVPEAGLVLFTLVFLAYTDASTIVLVVTLATAGVVSITVPVWSEVNQRILLGIALLVAWGSLVVIRGAVPAFDQSVPVVAAMVLLGVVYLLVTRDAPGVPDRVLRSPPVTVLVLLVGAIWFGYLLRDQLLFVSYVQDVFPYVAILGGIALKELVERDGEMTVNRNHVFALVVLATIPSLLVAPYINADHGAVERPFDPGSGGTVSNVQAIGDDIDRRTEPNETIFTAQPLFAVESEATNANSFSRAYWFFLADPYSERANATASRLNETLSSGETSYVIWESRTQNLFETRPDLGRTFRNNYCRIRVSNPAYDVVGARLYVYDERAPNC